MHSEVLPIPFDSVQEFRDRGFVPPEIPVRCLPLSENADAWNAMCPVPLWLEMRGRRLRKKRPVVRLAWTHGGDLVLRAENSAPPPPDPIPPGDPDFWLQEHLEILFIPRGATDEAVIQILVTPWGTWWDNRAFYREIKGSNKISARTVQCPGRPSSLELRIALSLAGLSVPPPPAILRALVAHIGPRSDRADYAVSSPVDLGFTQTERFGRLVFLPPGKRSLLLSEVLDNSLELYNPERQKIQGYVRLDMDGPFGPVSHRIPLAIPPHQRRRIPISLALSPHRFTHVACWFENTTGVEHLGRFCRRTHLPSIGTPSTVLHPYLVFDRTELKALRQKTRYSLIQRFFRLCPHPRWSVRDIPNPEDPSSFAFTPDSYEINWFRVARETMIRDGAGNRRPAARRIWEFQSETAQKTWREVVQSVTPTRNQLKILSAELNRLLDSPDLYDETAFRNVELPAEGRRLLKQGLHRLPREQLRMFNRILLQSAVECIGNYRMDLVDIPGQCFDEWLRTGRRHIIQTATHAVRAALRHTILDYQIHLHEGMAAAGLALAYDAFHPHLQHSDRLDWRSLMLKFLDLYAATARRASWTVTTLANANAIGNSGCGLLALALLAEEPERARQTLHWVREYLWNWLDYAHGPNGGNTEGAQYWAYAMEHFLLFAQALERVTGSDDGFLNHPAVVHSMNMVRNGLSNDGAMSGVNDTIPFPVGGTIGWFVANRFADPLGLWYGDHAMRWLTARQTAGKPVAYSPRLNRLLLWRPEVPENIHPPSLPTVSWLPETETVLLRSAPRLDADWVAGLKGARPPFTHHNQADTGAFWLDFQGDRMILDPGYYKPRHEDHSLPIIGGIGPTVANRWVGRIVRAESRGTLQYAACDSTAAYNGKVRRVIRHLVIAGSEGIVLLEDIEADQEVRSLFQCGGPVHRISPDDLEIQGNNVCLRMRIKRQESGRITFHPERSVHDTHWGYHFADCRWFPIEVAYVPSSEDPLLLVFTDGGRPSRTVHFDRSDHRLIIVLDDVVRVSFSRLSSGWILE